MLVPKKLEFKGKKDIFTIALPVSTHKTLQNYIKNAISTGIITKEDEIEPLDVIMNLIYEFSVSEEVKGLDVQVKQAKSDKAAKAAAEKGSKLAAKKAKLEAELAKINELM